MSTSLPFVEPEAVVRAVRVPVDGLTLVGELIVPHGARGVVVLAPPMSGASSPRDRFIATALHQGKLATLSVELLTPDEARHDARAGRLRFDIARLADRLGAATDWVIREPSVLTLPVGYFGAEIGAAAAFVAAAHRPGVVRAIVTRSGRPDLAAHALDRIHCPVLLIVGSCDVTALELNADALMRLCGEKVLEVIPNARHLFAEPGALEHVALLTREWFEHHLVKQPVAAVHQGW